MRPAVFRAAILAIAVACSASATAVAKPQGKASDGPLSAAPIKDPFLDAQEAFRLGDARKLGAAAGKLKHHSLAPYVEYYQLRMRIGAAAPGEVTGFIERYGKDYIGDVMRGDWLMHLAQAGRWNEFDALYPKVVVIGPELRCFEFTGRRKRPDPQLADAARQFWMTEPDLPGACEDFYRTAFKLKMLPERLIWQRARRQIELGRTALGRAAFQYLPPGRQPDNRTWQSLSKRPEAHLAGLAADKNWSPDQVEQAMIGLTFLARMDPADAAAWLTRHGSRFDVDDRQALWVTVAMQGTLAHHEKAADWFTDAGEAPLTDEQHRWRTRAALRRGDFSGVALAIAAMPPAVAAEPAWIYWQGRALAAASQPGAARTNYARIAEQANFYGVLAAEELGQTLHLPARASPPLADEVAVVSRNGAVQRSLALIRLDLRIEAIREWSWAMNGMNDRQLLAAAEFARRHEVFDRAISAADRTRAEHDYGMRYLTPYEGAVRPAALRAELDDAWVYGLIRQESRFVDQARSSAGAQGLMQVMPATARWVARNTGLADYHPARVNDVDLNIRLGTSYLRLVYEKLDKNPVLASAAYNAGPGRARKWRDPVRSLEGAVYAETIPFTETRDYVKKVMANTVFYSAILGSRSESLKSRLGIIRPGNGGQPDDEELP